MERLIWMINHTIIEVRTKSCIDSSNTRVVGTWRIWIQDLQRSKLLDLKPTTPKPTLEGYKILFKI